MLFSCLDLFFNPTIQVLLSLVAPSVPHDLRDKRKSLLSANQVRPRLVKLLRQELVPDIQEAAAEVRRGVEPMHELYSLWFCLPASDASSRCCRRRARLFSRSERRRSDAADRTDAAADAEHAAPRQVLGGHRRVSGISGLGRIVVVVVVCQWWCGSSCAFVFSFCWRRSFAIQNAQVDEIFFIF